VGGWLDEMMDNGERASVGEVYKLSIYYVQEMGFKLNYVLLGLVGTVVR